MSRQEITWAFIRRYMDISMPLPDIPALEPFRGFDPATAAHDDLSGRDPYFWRAMSRLEMRKAGKKTKPG